ncbi:hypothetical protein SMA90_31035, partial [Escherichia coli]
ALNAKREARAYADANGYSRNQRSAYADEQEQLARKAAEEKYFGSTKSLDRTDLNLSIEALETALTGFTRLETQEKAAYAEVWREEQKAKAAKAAE